jgi:hypothetical protein
MQAGAAVHSSGPGSQVSDLHEVTKIEARKGLTIKESLQVRFGNLARFCGRAFRTEATAFSAGIFYVSSDAQAFSEK